MLERLLEFHSLFPPCDWLSIFLFSSPSSSQSLHPGAWWLTSSTQGPLWGLGDIKTIQPINTINNIHLSSNKHLLYSSEQHILKGRKEGSCLQVAQDPLFPNHTMHGYVHSVGKYLTTVYFYPNVSTVLLWIWKTRKCFKRSSGFDPCQQEALVLFIIQIFFF